MNGEIRTRRTVGDDGEWVVEPLYFVNGVQVTEKEFRKFFPDREGTPGMTMAIRDAKPCKSNALAVHPTQIEQARARNKRHGINVDYEAHSGRPIFTDSGQRRKLMKLEGVRDRNSYFGY